MQTPHDITCVFATHKPAVHKTDVKCQLARHSIDMRIMHGTHEAVLLAGPFEHAIDVDASAWTVDGPK